MMFRVTYTTPTGANRVVCTDSAEALATAQGAAEGGATDVWIGDEGGRLFTIREFEHFMQQP
jgi:hypothetical protein